MECKIKNQVYKIIWLNKVSLGYLFLSFSISPLNSATEFKYDVAANVDIATSER